MHEPIYYRLRLAKSAVLPYRPQLRSCYDEIPICCASLPLAIRIQNNNNSNEVKAPECPDQRYRTLPTHRQVFDLEAELKLSPMGTPIMDDVQSDRTVPPKRDTIRLVNRQPEVANTQSSNSSPLPSLSPSPSPQAVMSVIKIRGHKHMARYNSSGEHPLRYPIIAGFGPPLNPGDLYIHQWGAVPVVQMWVRVDGLWREVRDGYSHPTIDTHCLYSDNHGVGRRVRWVHKDTVASYKSKKKHRGKSESL